MRGFCFDLGLFCVEIFEITCLDSIGKESFIFVVIKPLQVLKIEIC